MSPHVKEAAIRLADECGLINLTRDMVAQECGFPTNSFRHHAGVTFTELVGTLEDEGHTGADHPIIVRPRMDRGARKQHVIEAAIYVAKAKGYQSMQRAEVAEAAGVSQALVSDYFGSMDSLRSLVVTHAVRTGVVEIVAQGLGAGSDIAKNAPDDIKQKALIYLAS